MRKLPVEILKPGMKVGRTVYSSDGINLIGAGTYLTENHIRRLKLLGVPAIYIDDGLMSDVEVRDIIREEVRVEAIKLVKDTLNCRNTVGAKIIIDNESVARTVEEIINDIMSDGKTVVNIVDIRTYDDYTFAHSVNVCVLAVLTGYTLGYSKSKLLYLGMGALLHDIGKTQVAAEILNKPGRLNEREFREVQKHTIYGYEILKNQPGLSPVVAEVAYQHHERYSGQGYPRGLKNHEIHEYARITGIADMYDALIAERVYRKAFAPHEAYEMLAGGGNNLFQFSILKAFLDNVAVYPVGTFVRLSTGEIGGVVKVYRGLTHRPTVRVYFNADGRMVKEPYEIDLVERYNITVLDVISEEVPGN